MEEEEEDLGRWVKFYLIISCLGFTAGVTHLVAGILFINDCQGEIIIPIYSIGEPKQTKQNKTKICQNL
jgi:hypothetical protein